MSNRFDSSGAFSPLSIKSNIPTQSEKLSMANASTHGSIVDNSQKKGGQKKDDTPEYAFEGNRGGVSPMKIGLVFGVALLIYGFYSAIMQNSGSANQIRETREYKRQIRPVDLPGR